MRKINIPILILAASFVFQSCSKFDDKLTDPSQPTPATADLDLFLNTVQLQFKEFFGATGQQDNLPGLSEYGEELTRMETLASRRYLDAYGPTSFDQVWRYAYQGVFLNANSLLPLAERNNKPLHMAIAKILKAYTAASLVDFFGDVPYTEAALGVENTKPKVDPGKQVYDSAFKLLDNAIEDLKKVTAQTSVPANDLFFESSTSPTAKAAGWRRVAKTIKLKMLNNLRLTDNSVKDKIEALIAENDLINTDAQAFTLKFSTRAISPNSRHPKFNVYYTDNGGADYINNNFMYMMYAEKGIDVDPRWRYYFFRQIGNTTLLPASTLDCAGSDRPSHYPPNVAFCVGSQAGFYGRDHGNDSGLPPDGFQKTIWGVYPAGGKFDADERAKISGSSDGAQGRGYFPLWQPAFTDFVKAELALTLKTSGDARALLESGVRKSIKTVVDFPATIGVSVPATRVPTATKIDDYVKLVLEAYDASTSDNERLNVIMKEYYLALWGNGVESYNNYRRTGLPKNMQPNLNPSAGSYLRSMFYPSAVVNRNNNIVQKTATTVKVFWDNNPENLFVN